MASGGIDQECIAGVINHAERLLVLLNLDLMFSREEQLLLVS
jgi:purine-binding chemotaxis protein CheW